MIRSTLFKSVAPALRDSLNDAEVGALGMWLLMSAGAYPRNITMFAKDSTGTESLEDTLEARYTYPEGITAEDAMAIGMINPEYRLTAVARLTAVNSVGALEDLLYTVAVSNEDRREVREAEAPPMPQPVPGRERTWHVQPFVERAVPPPPQENRIVGRDTNVPRFTPTRTLEQVEQDILAVQAEAATEDHARRTIEWMQRNREVGQARVDALANRTRGIPNRR